MKEITVPLVSLIAMLAASSGASAQEAGASEQKGLNDIIVTARKRTESVQDVPVAVTAMSAATIERQDLTSIEKIAARIPTLTVGRAAIGSGAQLTMRGIGSSSTSIGIEQSVATVVDGVYYGQGRVINEGFFDLQRAEVLKGPQALFFGKNATAGVISLSTADPSNVPEFKVGAAYEFAARQAQLEFVGSGPLSDTLGIRVAIRGSKMWGGYYDNISPPVTYTAFDVADGSLETLTAAPGPRRTPGEKELMGRVTLKWEPTSRLTATLKASGSYDRQNNSSWNYVTSFCPTGVSQLNGFACKADFITHQNDFPLAIAKDFPFAQENGGLYNRYISYSATANIVYNLDDLTITSVSNYNWNNNRWGCACDSQSSSNNGTWATENTSYHAFSSELRALTSFDGPLNLMIGGLYQKTKRTFEQYALFAGVEDSSQSARNRYMATSKTSFTNGETVALFGQVTWKIVPTLELAAGARYTHETKDSFFTQPYNNILLSGIFRSSTEADGLGIITANQTFNNWSPEATLSWKIADKILAYAAYKTAYKSGGFSNGGINSKLSATPYNDLAFDPEKARGFEGGLKTTFADNQLRVNLSAYSYAYKDLQIDFFNAPVFAYQTSTADARTKGVELEVEFAPRAIDGLTLHGSANYNRARYTSFPLAPCYAGESQSEGCNIVTANGIRQNLNGAPLSVAPEWTGTLGFNYDASIGNGLKLGLSADMRYSSSYLASSFGNADSRQSRYATLDASIRLGQEGQRWELALIGKNLTNRFYIGGVVDGPSTGSAAGGLVAAHADQLGFGNTPRTVRLQATTRF